MGLKEALLDEYGNLNEVQELRDVTRFLNRILVLDSKLQNDVFDAFSQRLDDMTELAAKNGALDVGLENLKADKIEVVDEKVLRTDENTGAETKYVGLKTYIKNIPLKFDDVDTTLKSFIGFFQKHKKRKY